MFRWTQSILFLECASPLITSTRLLFAPTRSLIRKPILEMTSTTLSGRSILFLIRIHRSFPPFPPLPSPRDLSHQPIPAGPKCGTSRRLRGTLKNTHFVRQCEREVCVETFHRIVIAPIRWASFTPRPRCSSQTIIPPRLSPTATPLPCKTRVRSLSPMFGTTFRSVNARRSTPPSPPIAA